MCKSQYLTAEQRKLRAYYKSGVWLEAYAAEECRTLSTEDCLALLE
jgi:hypothetical protein